MGYEQDLPKVVDNSEKKDRNDVQQGANDALFADSYGEAKVRKDKYQEQGDPLKDGSKVEQQDQKHIDKLTYKMHLYEKETPTKEERQEAKDKLDKTMSPLVSDSDMKVAQNITHALLDGNTKELTKALAVLKDDPERMKKFVEEINHDLKEAHAGISMAIDSQGHVLTYKDHGSSAVQIDLNTGASTVRPISVGWDGTVTLQPGEVLNADANKTLQQIADSGVNAINKDHILWGEFPHRDPIFKGGNGGWENPGFFPKHKGWNPELPMPYKGEFDFDPKQIRPLDSQIQFY